MVCESLTPTVVFVDRLVVVGAGCWPVADRGQGARHLRYLGEYIQIHQAVLVDVGLHLELDPHVPVVEIGDRVARRIEPRARGVGDVRADEHLRLLVIQGEELGRGEHFRPVVGGKGLHKGLDARERYPADGDVGPHDPDIEPGLQGAQGGCRGVRRDARGKGDQRAARRGVSADNIAADDLCAVLRSADKPFDAQGLCLVEGQFYDRRLHEHLGPERVDLVHDPPDLFHVFRRRADEQRVRGGVGGDEDLLLWGLRLLPLGEQGLQCLGEVGRARMLHVIDLDPGELP